MLFTLYAGQPHGSRSLEAANESPAYEPPDPITVTGPRQVLVDELPQGDASGLAQDASAPLRPTRERPPGPVPRANATGATAGAAGSTAAPDISSGWDGLDGDANTPGSLSPPSPQVAVGPDHVVEFVNRIVRIYDRAGGTDTTFPLADLFGLPDGHSEADPLLVYDAMSARWFGSYVSFLDNPSTADEGVLYLAVSDSDDPTGAWNVYTVPYTNTYPEATGLGMTNDKVTVSSNVYDIDGPPGAVTAGCSTFDGFCGVQTIVFQKTDLIAGVNGPDLDRHAFPLDPGRFSVVPARSLSSINEQYLSTWNLDALDILTVIKITGTPDEGNVIESVTHDLVTVNQLDPPPSRTAGTGFCFAGEDSFVAPPCIDSGDYSVLSVVFRDNTLWSASTASCLPDGDAVIRACAHLVEADTSGAPSLTQDIMFGANGHFYSYPSVITDASNNLFVSMTHTSTSIFAEAVVSGRLAGDPAGSMGGTAVLAAGEIEHASGRWGDYLGAAIDPEQPGCVWVVGEYAKDTSIVEWGTFIAAVTYTDGCAGAPPTHTPTPPPGATSTPTPPPGATATPTRTPTPDNQTPVPFQFGDANCDGLVNALDAVIILQYDARLTFTLPCFDLAHANLDGVVNALDAALIIQYDAGMVPLLPVGLPS